MVSHGTSEIAFLTSVCCTECNSEVLATEFKMAWMASVFFDKEIVTFRSTYVLLFNRYAHSASPRSEDLGIRAGWIGGLET